MGLVVDAKVPFLLGKKTLKLWDSKIDIKSNVLEICIDGLDKDFKMVDTSGNHYAMVLDTRREDDKNVVYMDKDMNEEDFVCYKEVKKSA